MKPEEKAKELYNTLYKSLRGDLDFDAAEFYDIKRDAKQCALKCVAEILKTTPTEPNKGIKGEDVGDHMDQAEEFWEQVKEEIAKL